MSRKAVLGAVSTFVLACGGAPPPAPKPPEPVAAPAPAPLPAVREAAPELRRYWVFGKSPELSLYADLEGLLQPRFSKASCRSPPRRTRTWSWSSQAWCSSVPKRWSKPRWQLLNFTFPGPQYYQYEVVAAKDGNSATVVARGDLNGDGKPSEFRLRLTLDPKTHTLAIAPNIEETSPEE